MLKKQEGYKVLALAQSFTEAIDATIYSFSKKSPADQEKDMLKDAELAISKISDRFLELANELNSLAGRDDVRPMQTAIDRATDFLEENTQKAQRFIDIITSNKWKIDDEAREVLAEYETDSNNMRDAIENAQAALER